MIELLSWVTLVFAVASTAMFLLNMSMFRRAPTADNTVELPPVSVLIPARNEELGIRKTLNAVLANQNVDFEVVVLDDQSDDATVQIVEEIAAEDPRVCLVHGRRLRAGWCGKQYACHQLAQHAKHDEFLFIDADGRNRSSANASIAKDLCLNWG